MWDKSPPLVSSSLAPSEESDARESQAQEEANGSRLRYGSQLTPKHILTQFMSGGIGDRVVKAKVNPAIDTAESCLNGRLRKATEGTGSRNPIGGGGKANIVRAIEVRQDVCGSGAEDTVTTGIAREIGSGDKRLPVGIGIGQRVAIRAC